MEELKPVGTDFLRLVSNYSQWVMRREEQVTFLNQEMLARSVRLDIDLTSFSVAGEIGLELRAKRLVVPLTSVSRKQLTVYQIFNEDGALLPRLNAAEERELVYAGVVGSAEEFLEGRGQTLTEGTRDVLYRFVHDAQDDPEPSNAQLSALRGDPLLETMLGDVRELMYLTTVLDPERGLRRVITFSYVEPVRPRSEVIPAAAGEKSPRPWSGRHDIGFDVNTTGECRSFELVVATPSTVRILNERLELKPPKGNRTTSVLEDLSKLSTRTHVQVPKQQPGRTPGTFSASLQLFPYGLARNMFVASVLTTTAIFLLGCLVLFEKHLPWLRHELDVGSGTEIFLLIPAIAGAVLGARSAHPLTMQLRGPIRTPMWFVSAAAVLAAGAVATEMKGPVGLGVWCLAGVVALVATIRAGLNWARLREDGKDRP